MGSLMESENIIILMDNYGIEQVYRDGKSWTVVGNYTEKGERTENSFFFFSFGTLFGLECSKEIVY